VIQFNKLPPLDRWAVLDRELPRMIESHAKSFEVDPTDEIAVEKLADRHGIGERAMVARLKEHGGMPYQIGARWFIRSKSYAVALDGLERKYNSPA
jgi:hypothetical protein